MRIVGFAQLLLLTVSAVMLSSCGDNVATTSEIDPAGHLTRQDYLALRHRSAKAVEHNPDVDDENYTAPPVPEMPLALNQPDAMPSGHDRMVSVSVTDSVPVRDVLIELGREAKVNLELDPRISGGIIFSAHNRPFHEVLTRICNLAGLRTVTEGQFIHVELDEPYQQSYQLDYLALTRHTSSETSIATNVFDVNVANNGGNSSSGGSGANGASASENNSTSKVSGSSDADFWSEVDKSLSQILAASARKPDAGKSSGNFSIDRQSGMVTVFGDSRQQAAIDVYLQKLKRKAYAQVLIDARIIEVELDDQYKAGIEWRTLFEKGLNAASSFGTFGAAAPFLTDAAPASGLFTAAVKTGDFAAIISLMDGFGTTRVLSSPRVTVLNNQTAVMKVATNQVYFVTSAQFTTVTNANGSAVTTTPVYTSTPHTVPVGLVMTVQPAIDADHDRVTMTLRPTISRVVDQVSDPSIGLNAAQAGVSSSVDSKIPVLAVREMDSVIQLHSGEVAVMGGLMQDSSINQDNGVPGLENVPIAGNLFKSRDNQGKTTELVILLRATIADRPSADIADRQLYKNYNDDPRPLSLPDNARPKHLSDLHATKSIDPPALPDLPVQFNPPTEEMHNE